MVKKSSPQRQKKYIGYAALGLATILVVVAVIIIATLVQSFQYRQQYEDTQDIRRTITEPVDALQQDAPRDAPTGDYYQPEARLMVPAHEDIRGLRYNSLKDENILNITDQATMNEVKSVAANVATVEAYFSHVPALQACSRGVLVRFEKDKTFDNSVTLAWQKPLRDGRTVYAYTDNKCPFIDNLAAALRGIESY